MPDERAPQVGVAIQFPNPPPSMSGYKWESHAVPRRTVPVGHA
jgi:hypothetical protein